MKTIVAPLILAASMAALAVAAQASPYEGQKKNPVAERVYSPYAGRDYPDQVLFGDTHFHTHLSFDAGLIGTTLDVDAAYRGARGEEVLSNSGQRFQLIRPLDFLVITDHAEMIGFAPMLREGHPALLADAWGKSAYERFNSGLEGQQEVFAEIIQLGTVEGVNPLSSNDATASIWQDFVEKAEQYNEPGHFTAMTGFEWTSTPGGDNLHRVVIFADGDDKTGRTLPFSMFDSLDPEDLWKYLAGYEEKTGGRAIAIPHNGNLSNGLMFNGLDFDGKPISADYARRRMRWEPLHEVSQIKGDEEAHPYLSPNDEFADFENWDAGNIAGTAGKEKAMLRGEYARSALRMGLEQQKRIGVNPYKFGLTAATDTHTALASSREENYFGKYKATEPSADRHNTEVIPAEDPALEVLTSQESAAGLTAVWARHNTRRDIFDALKRKEVYATTGTRIRVRVFAGWDFAKEEVSRPDFADQGYRRGVPMGGDLSKAPAGAVPRFMVRALRDPDGANLDRVQVIKGWVDASGETHERIYDVAVSDGREIGRDGRCKTPVGSTVDLDKATYTNTIGEPVMAAYWEDPDFDPAQAAFYYVRVLEIPTPRWTTYDAAFFNIPRPERVPATIQDRAYTSPIWYTPGDPGGA
ncbi:DUF3604 domain-containing protein [Microbulbifer flavimaris]|uniref:DUF3604 domain-containing protein n=1 Tax=Microbulbifer flavimaris TaxID=1781068 RepID=A0ABX4HY07_9GAMM|nr:MULTISPECIES: DUF3604 domain-containing protein [Microbulbifer]KUJ82839.1 hypothetical protein AVO43_09740 [Microbulbifer sp. ZGT114]PCO05015.1 DUF3604 domain-containing protein [Microbulbifer flavimaris]